MSVPATSPQLGAFGHSLLPPPPPPSTLALTDMLPAKSPMGGMVGLSSNSKPDDGPVDRTTNSAKQSVSTIVQYVWHVPESDMTGKDKIASVPFSARSAGSDGTPDDGEMDDGFPEFQAVVYPSSPEDVRTPSFFFRFSS
jgi:hypothetical protein